MSATTFGKRLREMREAKNLSQTDFAVLAGMTRSGISKIELGEREPSWGVVQKLANALGVDCTAFTEAGGSASVKEEGPTKPRKGKPKKKAD